MCLQVMNVNSSKPSLCNLLLVLTFLNRTVCLNLVFMCQVSFSDSIMDHLCWLFFLCIYICELANCATNKVCVFISVWLITWFSIVAFGFIAIMIVTPSQVTMSSCYAYPLVIITYYLRWWFKFVVKIYENEQTVNTE